MFHVVAMPIHNMGDTPMTAHSEMKGKHTVHQHAKMISSDHQESHDSCPSSNGACCITLSFPFNHIDSISFPLLEKVYVSLTFSSPKSILETLYRPPKFFA